jgi:putative SOS response-associated peptidase YedK
MCGRYSLATPNPAEVRGSFPIGDEIEIDRRFNIAPGDTVLAVTSDRDGKPRGDLLRWGLVPFWAKNPAVGSKMINTRAETATEKPAFRKALARRRCLVPADGWYEWRRDGKEKEAFFMTGPDSAPLTMAGIWESWRDPKAEPDASPLITFSVLTTESVGSLVDIHHRMPLILPKEHWETWLNPDAHDVSSLLAPPSLDVVDTLELRPVSNRVNNVRNNGPELVERVEAAAQLDEGALFELPRS